MKQVSEIMLWLSLAGLSIPTLGHDETTTNRMPVVLSAFPTDPALLQPDVRPLVNRIIAAHGLEEWKATLLTNELHRHLGTYSIIGAKMGVRARELLGAEFDELRVESYAGLKPPLSCLNDGLQVSTGASLGRGAIRVMENRPPAPEAVFIHDGKTLRLRLKQGVVDRIRADIAGAIKQHGNLTPAYFDAIRKLSLWHWAELNRSEMFEETMGPPQPDKP
jgi:pyrimidine-specific ribonucleoside hydrolase